MNKINLQACIVMIFISCLCASYAMSADTGLIRVLPGYHEAMSAQNPNKPNAASQRLGEPTPREQMYVFWLLGKALSYPVDRVESYVLEKLRRRPHQRKRITLSATPNPFDAVDLSQIPPAPPVLKGAAAIPHR